MKKRIVAIMTNRDNRLCVVISRSQKDVKQHTYTPTNASKSRLDMWAYGKHNHIVLESGGPVVYISD